MGQPTKILLAEDNPTDALLVCAALEQREFELHHVERLDEALSRLEVELFDVLLLDLGLPDSQGLETLSSVRRSSQIPVVVLTGLADEAMALSALSAGAQDYLVKGEGEDRNLVRSIHHAVERNLLLARERVAREQAEAALRSKDLFLAVLSHELRTPLTPVMLLVSALRQTTGLPIDVLNDLETIHFHVEEEVRLINNLLDLAGIQTGKLQLQRKPLDAHVLIRDVISGCGPEAKAKNINIEVHLDAGSIHIDADPVRMKQALGNVLGNAIKFTMPAGSIVVSSQDSDDNHLRVQVIDNGVGIEPDAMPRIFSLFEQGEQKLTRRFGGLGIGLSICRAIIELHGGRILASSEGENRGATFTIDLPHTRPAVMPESVVPPISNDRIVRKPHILLVEDDQPTANVLARLLRSLGNNVSVSHSAGGALRAFEEGSFDLILSDIGLPDASGWDMMRQMQSIRPIRGIALSGFVADEDTQKSLEAGFRYHLRKPISIQQLAATLTELLPNSC